MMGWTPPAPIIAATMNRPQATMDQMRRMDREDTSGETEMDIREQLIAQASFLIRKPVAEVFEAFANPDVITKFWLERSTGRLEEGASVRWYFTPDLSTEVRVLDVSENERIRIEWGVDSDNPTTVEWTFVPRSDDTTFVKVVNQGFSGDGDTMVNDALDSTGGFSIVLTAAKAYLEHGIVLNIVADKA